MSRTRFNAVGQGNPDIGRGISRGSIVEPLELHASLAAVDELRRGVVELVTRQRKLDECDRQQAQPGRRPQALPGN